MQPFSGIAYAFGQVRLDKGVDVLIFSVEGKRARLYIVQNGQQPVGYFFAVSVRNYALPAEHGGVGKRPFDILPVHPAVKGERPVEIVGPRVELLFESACP